MKKIKIILIVLISIFLTNQNIVAQVETKLKSSKIKCAKYVYKQFTDKIAKNSVVFKKKKEYKTFFDFLMSQIKNNGLTAYSSDFYSNNFSTIFTLNEIEERINDNTEYKISSYLIQEINFYDFNNNIIRTEILGVTPVLQRYDENSELIQKKVFDIYYPELLNNYQKLDNTHKSTVKAYFNFFEKKKYKAVDLADVYTEDYKDLFVNIYENKEILSPFVEYEPVTEKPISLYKSLTLSEIKFAKYKYERVYKDSFPSLFLPASFLPASLERGYSNFFDFLMKIVRINSINAYSEVGDDIFGEILTLNELKANAGEKTETFLQETLNGEWQEITTTYAYNSSEITSYLVKEICLYGYDNQLIETQTIGICPIRQYYRDDDINSENPLYKKVAWFYFPQIQQLAAQSFATRIDFSDSKTFEQLFFNQQFKGVDISDTTFEYNKLIYPSYTNLYVNLHDNEISKFLNNIIEIKEIENAEVQLVDNIEEANNSKLNTKEVFTIIYPENDNYQIFEPENMMNGYKSFMDIIMENKENLTFYNAKNSEEILPIEELYKNLGYQKDSVEIETYEYGLQRVEVVQPINTSNVKQYKLEELWSFNAKGEVVDKQIIAIYPIFKNVDYDNDLKETFTFYEVCKINFKDLENICKSSYVAKVGEYMFEDLRYLEPEKFNALNKNLFIPQADMTYYEYFTKRKFNVK